MTNKPRASRRTFLGAAAALGMTGLSGCMGEQFEQFQNGGDETEWSEITGITVRETPDDYNNEQDYFAVVSDDLQKEYEIGTHRQIRLRLQASGMEQWRLRPAIFTTKVEPDFTSERENTIWLSSAGMDRISAEPKMVINALPFATSPNYDTIEAAKENNELIEQSITKDETLLACASNGGQIFKNTELQALHVSSESNASSWLTAGFDDRNNAKERWHVRPELINPKSYNDVRFLVEDQEYEYAVNFLGHRDSGPSELIIIGGLVENEVKNKIKTELENQFDDTDVSLTVRLENTGQYAGTDTQNIVNRFSDDGDNGLQIVQSRDIHTEYWERVANAVLKTFQEEDGGSNSGFDPSAHGNDNETETEN